MSEAQAATDRRAELEAELERVKQAEAAEAEERRKAAELERRERELTPEMRQEAEELERRAEEELERDFPQPWQPQKSNDHPQQLVGKVLRIDPSVGPSPQYGTYSACVEVLTTALDEWTVWANEGGVLHRQLVRLRIQPGDMIGIRYRGKKQSNATGYSYQDYKLVRLGEHDAPEFVDWDAVGREREQPQLPPAPAVEAEAEDDIPF